MVTIDEFFKIDLRVGRIVSAANIPNKQKVLKVDVDVHTNCDCVYKS
jgi:tRNA-binding EMAP/Myf-like protein